jgi:hypothetical protein
MAYGHRPGLNKGPPSPNHRDTGTALATLRAVGRSVEGSPGRAGTGAGQSPGQALLAGALSVLLSLLVRAAASPL